jgi:hypothetical protein
MVTANNLEGFLTALGRSSVQAGVLVLVVMAVQVVFRKQLARRDARNSAACYRVTFPPCQASHPA